MSHAQLEERAFDFPAHARRLPWLRLGWALLVGLVAGSPVGRRHR